MSFMRNNQHHFKIESNNIDPDDGNSWLCTACNLPIFATPFTGGGTPTLLHDHCVDLPEILKNCELHPQKPLLLGDNKSSATCSECSDKCGSKFYFCPDFDCGLVLDVACALPVKILHRSHRHRLMAVRSSADSSSFHKCGICGVVHEETAAAAKSVSYFCNVCGFWIHPDCATSANVIVHEKHVHPLVLFYDVSSAFGAQASLVSLARFRESKHGRRKEETSCNVCATCENDVVATRFGVYSCIDCRDCTLHMNCVMSDRRSFKPVLGRDAPFANVVRLPVRDEHQSIVSHVRTVTRNNIITDDVDDVLKNISIEKLHRIISRSDEHHFIRHNSITKSDEDEDEDENDRRVCDACLKIIKSSDPFYTCSICPNLFFHDLCFHPPIFLIENPTHSPLFLMFFDYNHGYCSHCRCMFIRAGYSCRDCGFLLDMSCGVMPSVVTHDEHATSHFLHLSKNISSSRNRVCDCCNRSLGELAYECRTCPNFALHTWCAMLPKTVTHKFDPHPLHLITATNVNKENNNDVYDICEICEHEMDHEVWYYGCERCNQSFHVDCIPCLDLMYKIKSLVRVGRIQEDIPTRLIRGLTLQGHGHDYCADVADEYVDILP